MLLKRISTDRTREDPIACIALEWLSKYVLWCRCHHGWHIQRSVYDSTFGRHPGVLWHDCTALMPSVQTSGANIKCTPNVPCITSLQPHLRLLRQKPEISLEDLTGMCRYYRDIRIYGMSPLRVNSDHFQKIERQWSPVVSHCIKRAVLVVLSMKQELFCLKNQSIDGMPPTEDAPVQQTRRLWTKQGNQHTETTNCSFSTGIFAWAKVLGSWVPVWVIIPEFFKACRELIKSCC